MNLTRLFRSEFVKNYKKKLCSDAYSNFTSTEYNNDIDEATKFIYENLIPNLALELSEMIETYEGGFLAFRIPEAVHRLIIYFFIYYIIFIIFVNLFYYFYLFCLFIYFVYLLFFIIIFIIIFFFFIFIINKCFLILNYSLLLLFIYLILLLLLLLLL